MTTGAAAPVPILQFFADSGAPLAGGSILTQVGGVNAPTYSDSGLTTALPNPIPLNARGEISTAAGASAQCFLTPGVVYTFTLSDASGNQVWVAEDVSSDPLLESGSFVGTWTGLTNGTVTGTINWARSGNVVTLNIPGVVATSNATTMTITGLPSALQPATLTSYSPLCLMTDNGSVIYTAFFEVPAASGTIVCWPTAAGPGGWTNSGTKGTGVAVSFSYLLA